MHLSIVPIKSSVCYVSLLWELCLCGTRALLTRERTMNLVREGGRGREGEGGRGGREEGRERRDECYTYSNGPQYLNSSYITYYVITCRSANNNDVTYYVITCKSPFDWVYTEQWYVVLRPT